MNITAFHKRLEVHESLKDATTLVDFHIGCYKLVKHRVFDIRYEKQQELEWKIMASEQEVPTIIEQDSYDDVNKELEDIHQHLLKVCAQLDRLIIRTTDIDTRVKNLNKVEKLVRRYNNIS